MDFTARTRRTITGAVCIALALGSLAPTAQAGHGRGHGPKVRAWENGWNVQRVIRPERTVIVRERTSDAGPALAGLIGGIVLGATLANAAHGVEVRYAYVDPYCHHRFATFESYRRHAWRCDHPRVVRVIDARSGECVHTYAWRQGDWRCEDDRWDDRGYDRGYDRRGADPRDWDDD